MVFLSILAKYSTHSLIASGVTFQVWVEMDSDQPTGWFFLCVYKITSTIVNMKTKRAYKYRFYPTLEQEVLLSQTFGCVRFAYNHILRWRTDEYYKNGNSINYNAASKKLTELKKIPEYAWLNQVSSVPIQQSLRHQQSAFKNFWEGRAKYPTFKKKHAKQSATLVSSAFSMKNGQLYIAKSKMPLNIRWSRPLASDPFSITISKDRARRYFVSMPCEFETKPMPISNKTVGIDLGLTDLFITFDGFKSGNPRHIKRYEAKLVEINRFFPSSKRCHACGFVNESLPLSIREWDCPECETHHDTDINAAKNIKTAGLAGLACGATGMGTAV